MTEQERNEIIARNLNISSEVLAEKIALSTAAELGRLVLKNNVKRLKSAQIERQIARLNLWKNN